MCLLASSTRLMHPFGGHYKKWLTFAALSPLLCMQDWTTRCVPSSFCASAEVLYLFHCSAGLWSVWGRMRSHQLAAISELGIFKTPAVHIEGSAALMQCALALFHCKRKLQCLSLVVSPIIHRCICSLRQLSCSLRDGCHAHINQFGIDLSNVRRVFHRQVFGFTLKNGEKMSRS